MAVTSEAEYRMTGISPDTFVHTTFAELSRAAMSGSDHTLFRYLLFPPIHPHNMIRLGAFLGISEPDSKSILREGTIVSLFAIQIWYGIEFRKKCSKRKRKELLNEVLKVLL